MMRVALVVIGVLLAVAVLRWQDRRDHRRRLEIDRRLREHARERQAYQRGRAEGKRGL